MAGSWPIRRKDMHKEGHGEEGHHHKWGQAFKDESMPAEERIKLLEEKKEFLTKKLGKVDALIAELKKT